MNKHDIHALHRIDQHNETLKRYMADNVTMKVLNDFCTIIEDNTNKSVAWSFIILLATTKFEELRLNMGTTDK